tara:strand:+ start:91 stop:270 length:180 start_codon:yes stop_codon:yes gene_type:complete
MPKYYKYSWWDSIIINFNDRKSIDSIVERLLLNILASIFIQIKPKNNFDFTLVYSVLKQ